MTVEFTVNGLRFNAASVPGEPRFTGTVSELGGAAARYESGGRVQQDGAWSTMAYLQQQAISLQGLVHVGSAAEIPVVVGRLRAAFSLRSVPLTVHWPSGDRTINVRRDGVVSVPAPEGDRIIRWSATVVADDPNWYVGGPSVTPGWPSDGAQLLTTRLPSTSGGLSFPLSFPTAFDAQSVSGDVVLDTPLGGWWQFQINAGGQDLVAPSVTVVYADGTTRRLAWGLNVAGAFLNSGESLWVDPQKRTSLLQGQASRPPDVRQWPTLEPGQVTVQFRATNASPTASLYVIFIPFG